MNTVLLRAENVSRFFTVKKGGFFNREYQEVAAVSDLTLAIEPNETLALVGESGSGKTTLSRLLLLLDHPSRGQLFFRDEDLANLDARQGAQFRRDVQPVFQNPYASLNPRMRVKHIVAEPLIVSARGVGEPLKKGEVAEQVAWALTATGLHPEDGDKFPHQFSGGQRQRIAIARAIACRPKLIILDEPVSSQDISIQAQILNLLKDLQEELGLSYLFIAHDLATVRFMSDRIAVMYQGKIVESGSSEAVFSNPVHPYTQALFAANLPDHPSESKTILPLLNELSNTTVQQGGCHYYNRCDRAQADCQQQLPLLRSVFSGRNAQSNKNQHKAACLHTQASAQVKTYG